MIYELGKPEDLGCIQWCSIKKQYTKVLSMEVVDFSASITVRMLEKDINNGYVSVLKIDGTIVATGCFVDNHITEFMSGTPEKGYGTFIMKISENIGEKFDKAYLDAPRQPFMKSLDL